MTTSVVPGLVCTDFDTVRHRDYAAVLTTDAQTLPLISIIVPTRNEADNIGTLVNQLTIATASIATEIIFVDDSDDNTPAIIDAARTTAATHITLIHRQPSQRAGGLGSAVVAGFHAARGTYVCVMDADMQHPPALVPDMLTELHNSGADIVVASRYWQGGTASGLNRPRTLVSRMSANAARLLFPGQLRQVTDPMSGFFLVRKAALNLNELHPRGD